MIYKIDFTAFGEEQTVSFFTTYSIVIGTDESPTSIDEKYDDGDYDDRDVTYLQASQSALTWDMSTDADITTTIRQQTGYINVVDTDGTLPYRDLIPVGLKEKKFHLWHILHDAQSERLGEDEIIVGYLRPESFTTKLQAPPREFSFPICCPLAAIADMPFAPTGTKSSAQASVAELLYMIIAGTGVNPDYIYFPGTCVEEWMSVMINIDHYYDYEYKTLTVDSDIVPVPLEEARTAKLNYGDALEELCTEFGICAMFIGKDWVFTKIMSRDCVKYTRITPNDLYSFTPGSTISGKVVADRPAATYTFPTDILSNGSKMEVRQGWKRVEVEDSESDKKDIFRINVDDLIDTYVGEGGRSWTQSSNGRFWYINIGTAVSGGRKWVSPTGEIMTHVVNNNLFGTAKLWVPCSYTDDDGEEHSFNSAEDSMAKNTPALLYDLAASGGYGAETRYPLITLNTPFLHYTSESYIFIKFKMCHIINAAGKIQNAHDDSQLYIRVYDVVNNKYLQSNGTWTDLVTTPWGIYTINGDVHNTYPTYKSDSETFAGFGFPAYNGVGPTKYKIDITGWFDGNLKHQAKGVFVQNFEVGVVHSLMQKKNKGTGTEVRENSSASVESLDIEMPFTQASYAINTPERIQTFFAFDYYYNNTLRKHNVKANVNLAIDLMRWGAHPREYLTLAWRGAPSLPVDFHREYTIGTTKYRLYSRKIDYERNKWTLKFVEID